MTYAYPLRELTVSQLMRRQCGMHGDKVFLTELWTGRRWTYAEWDAMVNRCAHALRGAGVEKGQHVGLLLGNSAEHLALAAAGRAEKSALYRD